MANSRSSKQTLADVRWRWQILLAMVSWKECNFERYPVCLYLWYFNLAAGNLSAWECTKTFLHGITSKKTIDESFEGCAPTMLPMFSLKSSARVLENEMKWWPGCLTRVTKQFHLLAQQFQLPEAIPVKSNVISDLNRAHASNLMGHTTYSYIHHSILSYIFS